MAAEKLRQLNLISNNTSRNLISGKEIRDVPSANQSLVCLCSCMHEVTYLKLIFDHMFWLSVVCIRAYTVKEYQIFRIVNFLPFVTGSVICP